MRCSKALSPLVTGLTLLAFSGDAQATSDEEAKQPVRRHRTSEILMRTQEPRGETTGSWLENVTIRKGIGLVYRHKIETDDHRKLVLSVGGPALKRKRLGLMFELRF